MKSVPFDMEAYNKEAIERRRVSSDIVHKTSTSTILRPCEK